MFIYYTCARDISCIASTERIELWLKHFLCGPDPLSWYTVYGMNLLLLLLAQTPAKIDDVLVIQDSGIFHLLIFLVGITNCLRWPGMCVMSVMSLNPSLTGEEQSEISGDARFEIPS